jgi:glycosyltransferase involved in cell wall biosynthesis
MEQPERVALVHDRLDHSGGAERMLWTLHRMFPAAPIFTAMWNHDAVPQFRGCDVRTTWMQRLPGIRRSPRTYAAVYPLAFAGLRLSGYDLVISLTTSFAMGTRTDKGAVHVCYCNSPANFVWRPQTYFRNGALRRLSTPLRAWLKAWDRRSANQPDLLVTSGPSVADRIRACYGREAAIVAPPIDQFWFAPHRSNEFCLFVGRLVHNKRVDLAINACKALGMPLWIVGAGRSSIGLRRLGGGNIRFLGRIADGELRELYRRAVAVVVPAEEDFGLVSLEAQAAGTPVVAYDEGGSRGTVVDGITGIRFRPQTWEALATAIRTAAHRTWDRTRITANAARYSEGKFRGNLLSTIEHFRRAAPVLERNSWEHRHAI